jgi:hypothetical protein
MHLPGNEPGKDLFLLLTPLLHKKCRKARFAACLVPGKIGNPIPGRPGKMHLMKISLSMAPQGVPTRVTLRTERNGLPASVATTTAVKQIAAREKPKLPSNRTPEKLVQKQFPSLNRKVRRQLLHLMARMLRPQFRTRPSILEELQQSFRL